jgi:uncharacterized damage-inducible protein DinB
MNKQYFIELATYNCWANKIVIGWLDKITTAQWQQPVVSSFESLEATALHITGAETAWLARLNNEASPAWLPSTFKGTKEEMIERWEKASNGLKAYIDDFEELALSYNLSFKRINGEQSTMRYYEIFAHVFNHSTFHRGQIVTLLRQVGFTELGSTDLLMYFRK